MSDYNIDTHKQSTSDFDWGSPILSESEMKLIKRLNPVSEEYSQLRKMAWSTGENIVRPDLAILRDYASRNQSGLSQVQKMRSIIEFGYYENRRLNESFLFDMWFDWAMGGDYSINTLTKSIEYKGEEVEVERLYTHKWLTYLNAIGIKHNTLESFIALLLNQLRKSEVNPWLKVINGLPNVLPNEFMLKHGFDPHKMCEFLTGDDRELQQFLWLVQFIGVVTRTYEPGCPHDHMLVLMSAEKGLRKTTLLQTIARPTGSDPNSYKYYVQLRAMKSMKQDSERLRGKIVVNIDECDGAFRGTNSYDLKETITNPSDNYRAPYAKTAKDHKRGCVIFGTTNTLGLLQDYSGDRRIFPVHVRKVINIDWVRENWADFWGFYKWAYYQMKSGNDALYRNWLNKTEESLLVACQSDYKAREPWLDSLEGVMDILEQTYPALAIKASDILGVIGAEMDSKKRYITNHIRDILRAERGYKEGRPKLLGGKQPGKPVLYLNTTDHPSPYPVSREDIDKAYRGYLQGIYPENKPGYKGKLESPQSELGQLPQFPEVKPEVAPVVLVDSDDPDDTPF